MEFFNPALAIGELVIVIALALVAIKTGALDRGGFLASVAVGFAIFVGGGWRWFVVIAAFFVLGVGFTFFKYEYKKSIGGAEEKGGARNWPNILANGGIAAMFGVAEFVIGGDLFAVMFLGAMSAAASDTVATELGLLNRSAPRLITHLTSKVSPGTSGGVTPLGFSGMVMASLIIGVVAGLLRIIPGDNYLFTVAICLAGGAAGSVVDSLVGATVQRKGICKICHAETEAPVHCGTPVDIRSGVRFVDNNIVNLLATIVGAVAALLVASVIL